MPRINRKSSVRLLDKPTGNVKEMEEHNLVRWFLDRKELININTIEKKAGIPRVIAMVLSDQPGRRLINHMDKIIPVVKELGYISRSGYTLK